LAISSLPFILRLMLCFTLSFLLSLKTLFNGLDSQSISKSLAFYELHSETEEGREALARAYELLHVSSDFPLVELQGAMNRFSSSHPLSEREVSLIEELGAHLPNRKLKGYKAEREEEILLLPPEEIDLGKGLVLSQQGLMRDLLQVRSYSALLDLMALQVLAHLSPQSTPEEKIHALNRFIFEESRFRFPPHSLYAKEIDLYTFLPSVMDNHLGVCLGVTAMYLALAQRLDLPLEIVTPPGHIFLRYKKGEGHINIETTARGIDLPDEKYLGVNLKTLKLRDIKEVIGMTHVNQASTYLHQGNFEKAVAVYQKAQPYLPKEAMVQELLGFSLLFVGEKEKGKALLKEAETASEEGKMLQENMAQDYLLGRVDEEGVQAIFMEVDEKRESVLEKQKKLHLSVERWPLFRAGLEHLAVTYLQLNRNKEALIYLNHYHAIDPENPVIEYYLAALYAERKDYNQAWRFLKLAEALTKKRGYAPKTLKELRKELIAICPEG